MPELDPARDPIEQLAEEWRERLRRGDRFEADEYVARHPDLADEIRDLFPAIVMMEQLKPAEGDLTGVFTGEPASQTDGPPRLERLGDYRILREVGRGGMGVVYEAEQESLGRRVALKVLPSHALADRQQEKRFRREARATARLHHTNIVPVYGVGDSDGLHYYVMQFIQGAPLDQVLAELKRLRKARSTAGATLSTPPSAPAPGNEVGAADVARSLLTGALRPEDAPRSKGSASGPRSPSSDPPSSGGSEVSAPALSGSSVRLPGQAAPGAPADSGRHYYLSVARVGIQVAEALDYANSQGIIHRDIKPSNLLLDNQGTVWVTDFGLAKALADGENLTHTGDIVGTLRYMAPERFTGQADARADIYSLGLTLYELLVQQPAFGETDRNRLIHQVTHEEPPPPRKLNPEIPRDLETVVLKAIEREPSRRYPTAAALAEDLKRFVEDKPISARRVSTGERLWRWCRRNPALASLTVGVAVLLLMLAVEATVAAIHFKRLAAQEHEAREKADASSRSAEQARASEARQREQAVAAREAAEAAQKNEARERTNAVAAQRLAERNFQEARRAIEELLTRVSEGRLKHMPGMQPIRKELLEAALKYYQGFVDRHGDDPTLKKDLADAYTRAAHILAEVGSRREALRVFDRALPLRTELLRRDPRDKKRNLDLVAHHQAVGNLHMRLRDPDAALKALRSAYDILLAYSPQDRRKTADVQMLGTGIAKGIPVHTSGDIEVLLAFAGVLNDMGAALQARDPGQAIQHYLQGVYIYRNLPAATYMQVVRTSLQFAQMRQNVPGASQTGRNLHIAVTILPQHDLARQWSRIGDLMGDLEMRAAATRYQKEAVRILENLRRALSRHPRAEEVQRDLAAGREKLAELYAARGESRAAVAEYEAALAIRRRQAQENPAVPDFQNDLAHCLFGLGLAQARNKDSARALGSLRKAVARQRALLATMPDEKPYGRALARQLTALARLEKSDGTPAEAEICYRQARGLWERLLFPPQTAAGIPALLAPTLAPLPALHGLAPAHVELLSAPPRDYVDLAAVRAACGDEGPALDALRQAVAAGCTDTATLQAAAELDPLRTREGFHNLVMAVAERNPTLTWLRDYQQARKQAARQKKDLFLYFAASDWVPSDVAFRKGMLSQPAVVKYLSAHFVPVLLDRLMFAPQPSNFRTTQQLTAHWRIDNFATMIAADPEGRAFWKSDKGSSEVANWKDAGEFLGQLESARKRRAERDRRLAQAEKAPTDAEKARRLMGALQAVMIYYEEDYRDVIRRIFELDRDNRLGLRARFFPQVLQARTADVRKLVEQRAWQRALAEANATLDEFAPADREAQPLYLLRARAHLGLGLFRQAAADFDRGGAVRSGDPELGLFEVYALVRLGEAWRYRRACAELLANYENTARPQHALLVALACGMAPDAVDDWSRVRALAERSLRLNWRQPPFWDALGLLHYRAGDLAAAKKAVQQSALAASLRRGIGPLLLALIEQRRGNATEARKRLDNFLKTFSRSNLETPHAAGDRDPCVYQQLVEEAAALFDGPPLADFPSLQSRRYRGLINLGRWGEAAALLTQRLAREPDNAQLYLERGRCYGQLKQAEKRDADFARVEELTAQAVAKERAAFDKGARTRTERFALQEGYHELARSRLRLGRVADAARALGELAAVWAGDGERLYEAAHDIAALVPVFLRDGAKRAAQEPGGEHQVADLTAATLAKAVDAGFVNTRLLRTDDAFRPLYARADFQALWNEMRWREWFPLATWANPGRSQSAGAVRARGLVGKRQWAEAEAAYAQAVKERPGDRELRAERGRFLARRGRWREAIAEYDAALEGIRNQADYWLERGRCHAALGQWERTAADFARALEMLPDDLNNFSASSWACKELAGWDKAFARVVELRPRDARLWIARARSHALRNRWPEASAAFARVIPSRPLSEERFEYAAVLLLAGKGGEYHNAFRDLFRRAGEKPEPFLAYVLARTGTLRPSPPAEAARLVRQAQMAVTTNPNAGWFLHALGAAQYRAGYLEQAVTTLERSIQAGWNEGRLNDLFLAMAHHRLGHAADARKLLNAATQYLDRIAPAIPGEQAVAWEPDWVEAQVIRREAEALLKTPARADVPTES